MRRRLAWAGAVLGLLLFPPVASASYHLMKISELGQNDGAGRADYLELQMYSSGQNLIGGHFVTMYQDDGTLLSTFEFPGNVALGDSQRTVLVVRDDGGMPPAADFVTPDLLVPQNGAACFIDTLPLSGIDCVAFGAFSSFTGGAPSPVGTPASALGVGVTLQRSIAPGCPTFLEDSDDSDDSATDFAVGPLSPRNNASPPTEIECDTKAPQTKIKKGPSGTIDKDTTKVTFRSNEPNSTFECKFDRKKFKPCESPKKLKDLDDGKHKFLVRATDAAGNTDNSPAKAKFKVVD